MAGPKPCVTAESESIPGWRIREIEHPGADDAVALLACLRRDTVELPGAIASATAQRVRFLGAYDETGRLVAVAGWRVVASTRSRILYVDDLVTDPSWRGGGAGGALLAWLDQAAVAEGCQALELDSGVTNSGAHRFYARAGFSINAFHFTKPVDSRAPADLT